MTIGQAATASGVSAKMIRYYDEIDLYQPAGRSSSGYRLFQQQDVHALQFIKRARDLGFSVEEIRQLLALWQNQGRASADVKALAMQHVEDLESRIEQLQAMVRTLRHLAEHCKGNERPDCPILDDLAGATAEPRSNRI
ncbi:MAG: Cu(I)-responsive transcriptional regulator [Ectothiorhodospiraceae bacterium]|nr:Cu(I)-responsive transcriptional regulator [Ectothiorhodospiraceae bacterium]MCH8503470.1 Cu(I)-responsive transcriptional regulator [Ectothiorhodospiraceae bacterium]